MNSRKLGTMEQTAQSSGTRKQSNFAGLLASLTAPKKDSADRGPGWTDGELGEDVVTLSYEQALRNHARYRAGEREDRPKPSAPEARSDEWTEPETAQRYQAARDLRTASVTIRLSKAERMQMNQRAAEAGLTVSAYLRSCVLEADALRAQVKAALAELKTAAGPETAAAPARRSWRRWFGRSGKRK
jgi:predicted DNA binding CopG/RHH family protein